MRRSLLMVLAILAASSLCGCAGLPGHDPLQVTVAGIESLPGEDLEMRMLVKLRVQNPNEGPIDYSGVYVKLDVQNSTLASGVSGERGTIPRYGESVIAVPVTVSMLRLGMRGLGLMFEGKAPEKIHYVLSGKLDGPAFGSTHFQSQGELALPNLAGPPAQ